MSAFTSVKWISSESGRLRINDTKLVLQPVWRHQCNLISIFGRARQGKSFLMNCLAGEREIFRISNEKESCTQGIDISNKWMTVQDFAAVDGGHSDSMPAAAREIRVGFVDAEGQGDKDVSYDANLICPILLASKCVIFNWKGDLQKDHILNTLGIMCRAAQNVGIESSGASGSKFGHLHIVFRDWQAVGSDARSTYDMLFGQEPATAEAGLRNKIRLDLQAAFASIKVWLFDAPTELVADLKRRLTLDKTSSKFRQQLRDLRAALTAQLTQPVVFGGQLLSGRLLHGATERMVANLNSGQVVLPGAAYRAMLSDELAELQKETMEDISSLPEAVLRELLTNEKTNHQPEEDKNDDAGRFPSIDEAQTLFNARYKRVTEAVETQAAQILVSPSNDAALSAMQAAFTQALAEAGQRSREMFAAVFGNAFHDWLLAARRAGEGRLKRLLSRVQTDLNAIVTTDEAAERRLDEKLTQVWALTATCMDESTRHAHSEAYKDAIQQLRAAFEAASVELRTQLQLRRERALQSRIEEVVAAAGQRLQQIIEGGDVSRSLLQQHVRGFPLASLSTTLNGHFSAVSRELEAQFQRLHLTAGRLKEVLGAFEAQVAATLQPLLVAHYASLRRSRLTEELPAAQQRLHEQLFKLAQQWEERMPPPSFEVEAQPALRQVLEDEAMGSLRLVAGWLVEDINELRSLDGPGAERGAGWQRVVASDYSRNLRQFLFSALLPFEQECQELLVTLAEEYREEQEEQERQKMERDVYEAKEEEEEEDGGFMDEGGYGYEDERAVVATKSESKAGKGSKGGKSSLEEQHARAKAWAAQQSSVGGKKGSKSTSKAVPVAVDGDSTAAKGRKSSAASLTSYGRKRQRALNSLSTAARGRKTVEEQRRAALEFAENVFGAATAGVSPEKSKSSSSSSSSSMHMRPPLMPVAAPAPPPPPVAAPAKKGEALAAARATAKKEHEDRVAEALAKRTAPKSSSKK